MSISSLLEAVHWNNLHTWVSLILQFNYIILSHSIVSHHFLRRRPGSNPNFRMIQFVCWLHNHANLLPIRPLVISIVVLLSCSTWEIEQHNILVIRDLPIWGSVLIFFSFFLLTYGFLHRWWLVGIEGKRWWETMRGQVLRIFLCVSNIWNNLGEIEVILVTF